ncbi:carbohydrate kinase [Nocardioides gansuensis]|uniref:Carbohydrate kinase n=1 Tax=Nocardioides gansuensis TaxID=2138300 RepID=A0A2T8FDN7_9ACTN|nr:sugar kinase [Nocardioides gansuensis]PVG83809.1 carbohydrate kinase [Nocardioides gansuensis]
MNSPLAPHGVVLCVGEALVALSPPGGTPLESADHLVVSEAGAEANVAVHLSRLGVPARFAGAVGDDPLGRRLRGGLAAEGVDVSSLVCDPDQPTGLYLKDPGTTATAVHYYRSGSAASAFAALPPGARDGITHVHLSGITPALSAACHHLVEELLLELPGVTTSFDVNHRPALWPADVAGPVLLALAQLADLVFVGLDEAAALWGTPSLDALRDLVPGPELVVKDSGRAAHAFSGAALTSAEALEVEVVEPVGAGDAFAAGYLAARRRGLDPAASLRTGHVVAAGALTVVADRGAAADPALLAAAEKGHPWPVPVGREELD